MSRKAKKNAARAVLGAVLLAMALFALPAAGKTVSKRLSDSSK